VTAKKLVCIICVNEGYTPGKSHFSARIANALRKLPDGERPDLIALLREYGGKADEISPGWRARVGEDFARGHKVRSLPPLFACTFTDEGKWYIGSDGRYYRQ